MAANEPTPPPRWADRFLNWFCRAELLEEIQGDLHEYYETELSGKPQWQAVLLYWYHILHFLRPFALKKRYYSFNALAMHRNYFKYAWRSIRLNLFFSSINIFGLGLGLASCILIVHYLNREWNYDKFHIDYENIYRLKQITEQDGIRLESATTFSDIAAVLQENYPSVKAVCRLHQLTGTATVEFEEKLFHEGAILGVDSSFFSLFNFSFLQGNPQTALRAPQSIVITERMSKKYFGEQDPLGKELIIDGAYGFWTSSGYQDWNSYTVSGVIENLPELTHLEFDFLISLNLYANLEQELKNWGDSFYTYFKINDPVQAAVIRAGLPQIIPGPRTDKGVSLDLQKMQAIHLDSNLLNEIRTNGNAQLTYFIALVAVILLLIAGTNYINFSTAKAINNKDAVGVRKIFGANSSQLFQQMLTESFLLNLLGLIFGLFLIYFNRDLLSDLLGFQITDLSARPTFWLSLAGFLLIGTLISGLYPAYHFSTLSSGRLIGRQLSTGKPPKEHSRRFLVLFQFSISLLVIGCALIMYRQMSFIQQKDLGFKLDNTIVFNGPNIGQDNDTLYYRNMNGFREEALRMNGVKQVAVANFVPGKEIRGSAEGYVRRIGTPEELAKTYAFTKVGFDFLPTLGIPLIAGRFFDPAFAGDLTFGESVVINREACRQLGFSNPDKAIGAQIHYRINSNPTIVGVVEDFHQYSLQRNFQPIIFEPTLIPQSYYYLKFSQIDNGKIATLQKNWESFFPGNAFHYFFLDDFYQLQYQGDYRFIRSFNLFALLAILIAIIGFLGLVYYTANARIKEIGIRRTFGAAFWDIFSLLSRGLGWLLLLSAILSIPLTYLLSDDWLTNYAYRINIAWWMLLTPVALLLLITLLIVLVQSVRTYRISPAEIIREA